jgi:two-component system NarL family response regulator
MSIRLMLVDDHLILREALREILEKAGDIAVVAEAGDGESAFDIVRCARPDIVVMDIGLPGINGIEATRRLLAENPGLRVLALSTFADRRMVTQMLEAGASGYVVKAAGAEELLRAIRAIAQGDTYLCPEIAGVMVAVVRGGVKRAGREKESLGRRESEVLALLADGRTSPEIAARMHIATSTVEVHRRNIMRKLGLHSVAELTKYAIRQGLTSA